jgi:hypothetical protein
MNIVNKILIVVIIVLLAASFIGGCQYGKSRKICPQITSDTVLVHDTITRTIVDRYPYYILGNDSIIYDTIPRIIDTAAILKDYYATHIYNRNWNDSLINVDIQDYVSENKPIHNVFSYTIKRPQQIIYNTEDNSITYDRFIYVGLSVPIRKDPNYTIPVDVMMVGIEGFYTFKTGYVGLEYIPEVKGINIKAGTKLFKFKK